MTWTVAATTSGASTPSARLNREKLAVTRYSAGLTAGHWLAYAWRRGAHETLVRITLHPRGERCIVALEHSAGSNRHEDDIAPYTYADEWFIALENLRRWLDGKAADIRIPWSQKLRGDIEINCLVDAPASARLGRAL